MNEFRFPAAMNDAMILSPALSSVSSTARILIVDDDTLFREELATRLRSEGYECRGMPLGERVLQTLLCEKFDALVIDIYIPAHEDFNFLLRISQVAAGMPVVLLTGKASVEAAVMSHKLLLTGYMAKPPDFSELLGILSRGIAKYHSVLKISETRQRLESWVRDLHAIESEAGTCASSDQLVPGVQFLETMTNNLLDILAEMETAVHVSQHAEKAVPGSHEAELRAAIKETVEVLLQTRQNFKSKRLGSLRQSLESLLQYSEPASAKSDRAHPSHEAGRPAVEAGVSGGAQAG